METAKEYANIKEIYESYEDRKEYILLPVKRNKEVKPERKLKTSKEHVLNTLIELPVDDCPKIMENISLDKEKNVDIDEADISKKRWEEPQWKWYMQPE